MKSSTQNRHAKELNKNWTSEDTHWIAKKQPQLGQYFIGMHWNHPWTQLAYSTVGKGLAKENTAALHENGNWMNWWLFASPKHTI